MHHNACMLMHAAPNHSHQVVKTTTNCANTTILSLKKIVKDFKSIQLTIFMQHKQVDFTITKTVILTEPGKATSWKVKVT